MISIKDTPNLTEVDELQCQVEVPDCFTAKARLVLAKKVKEFSEDLSRESVEIARRHRADSISAADVEQAVTHLISRDRARIYKHLGTIGGIILGAALSAVLGFASLQNISTSFYLVVVALCIIGTFMVALHVAKD
jgi:VIT1/CCC1 family predicted Fe2+/Mn2+ transporter